MRAGNGSFWEKLEDKVFAPLWFRRVFGVAIGLLIAYWPIDVSWRAIADPPVEWASLDFIAPTAGFVIVAVGVGVTAASSLGHSPAAGGVLLVPLIGGVFAVLWMWRLAPSWQSNADRRRMRGRVMEGMSDLDRSVYRLRFDIDETRFYSRRRVARRLGVTVNDVEDAEKRIEARIASEGAIPH